MACQSHSVISMVQPPCTLVLVNFWNIGVHAAFQFNYTLVVLTKSLAVLG